MKFFLPFLLLLSSSMSLGYAQSDEKIAVPVLKESKQIDQLMDMVLDPKNADKFERPNNSTDSCYLIFFFKSGGDHFSFQIEKNTKSVTNIIVNSLITNPNFGCFLYKAYKIFVIGGNGFYDFFNKQSQTISFDFVNKLQHQTALENEHFLAMWHYQFENGQFSIEGPPAVKQLEKN